MQLIRVQAAFDWKHRPSVTVLVIAVSSDRNQLIEAQNADIAAWQKDEIEQDIEMEREEAEDEGRPVVPHSGEWRTDTRWEMARIEGEDLRVFTSHIEGEPDSITYHILD